MVVSFILVDMDSLVLLIEYKDTSELGSFNKLKTQPVSLKYNYF